MKFFQKVGAAILTVLGTVFVILSLPFYLLYLPFSVLRYRRSPYFKATRKPYRPFILGMTSVKIYNRTVKAGRIPDYHMAGDEEYFVRGGEVLFCGWDEEKFEEEEGIWLVRMENDDGETLLRPAEDVLAELRATLPPEHRGLDVKFMLPLDIVGTLEFEENCPYVRNYDSPVFETEDFAE